jgi:hypothetical protein
MLRPLPYRNPEKLAVLTSDSEDPQRGGFLLKDIDSLRSESRSFSDIAFYYRDSGFSQVTLTDGTEPESVQGAFVKSNLFSGDGHRSGTRPGLHIRRERPATTRRGPKLWPLCCSGFDRSTPSHSRRLPYY